GSSSIGEAGQDQNDGPEIAVLCCDVRRNTSRLARLVVGALPAGQFYSSESAGCGSRIRPDDFCGRRSGGDTGARTNQESTSSRRGFSQLGNSRKSRVLDRLASRES